MKPLMWILALITMCGLFLSFPAVAQHVLLGCQAESIVSRRVYILPGEVKIYYLLSNQQGFWSSKVYNVNDFVCP